MLLTFCGKRIKRKIRGETGGGEGEGGREKEKRVKGKDGVSLIIMLSGLELASKGLGSMASFVRCVSRVAVSPNLSSTTKSKIKIIHMD